jgi:hypothetical protein
VRDRRDGVEQPLSVQTLALFPQPLRKVVVVVVTHERHPNVRGWRGVRPQLASRASFAWAGEPVGNR